MTKAPMPCKSTVRSGRDDQRRREKIGCALAAPIRSSVRVHARLLHLPIGWHGVDSALWIQNTVSGDDYELAGPRARQRALQALRAGAPHRPERAGARGQKSNQLAASVFPWAAGDLIIEPRNDSMKATAAIQ